MTGKSAAAGVVRQGAYRFCKSSPRPTPASPCSRIFWPGAMVRSGTHYRVTGSPGRCIESYGKALAIQQKLAEANPSVPDFRRDLAFPLSKTGLLLSQIGRLQEAFAYYAREEAIWRTLVDQNPSIPDYQRGLANCRTNTAELLIRTGRLAEARVMCDQALAAKEAQAKDYPLGLAETLLRDGQVRWPGRSRRGGRSLEESPVDLRRPEFPVRPNEVLPRLLPRLPVWPRRPTRIGRVRRGGGGPGRQGDGRVAPGGHVGLS